MRQATAPDEEQPLPSPEDVPEEAPLAVVAQAAEATTDTDSPPEAAASPDAVAKFVKLPARPVRPNAGQQAPLVSPFLS